MSVRELIERESDPTVPPWTTVRFWLGLVGLAVSVVALVLAA